MRLKALNRIMRVLWNGKWHVYKDYVAVTSLHIGAVMWQNIKQNVTTSARRT